MIDFMSEMIFQILQVVFVFIWRYFYSDLLFPWWVMMYIVFVSITIMIYLD